MKNKLLVTVADKVYLNMAKQLFSSVYFNSGWKGDYMLLSYDVPEKELAWFRQKGILVKEFQTLYNRKIGEFPALAKFSKFYLFTSEFKEWDNIIYMDADCIVEASLDTLSEVSGFWAVQDGVPLLSQFVKVASSNKNIFTELWKKYDLNELSFSSGVFAFSTDQIDKNEGILDKMASFADKYGGIFRTTDQPIFNLIFYKKWEKLPVAYNCPIWIFNNVITKENRDDFKWVTLHFATDIAELKPWNSESLFQKDWKNNLAKADSIDLDRRLPPKRFFREDELSDFQNRYESLFRKEYQDRVWDIKRLKFEMFHPHIYSLWEGVKVFGRRFRI